MSFIFHVVTHRFLKSARWKLLYYRNTLSILVTGVIAVMVIYFLRNYQESTYNGSKNKVKYEKNMPPSENPLLFLLFVTEAVVIHFLWKFPESTYFS